MDNTNKQFLELQILTDRFGIIHEAQAAALKNLPVIAIKEAVSSTIEFFPDKKEIAIDIQIKGKRSKLFNKQVEFVAQCVKHVMGEKWCSVITVKQNGKTVYEFRD